MRILWVEDNEKISQRLINEWFGNFEKDHDIKRFKSFGESYHYINNDLNNFDLVILDINLESGTDINLVDFPDIIFPEENESFLKEAGFHLYLQLLRKGFPIDRIIFLTSNTNNADKDQRLTLVQNFENARKEKNRELLKIYQVEIEQSLTPIQLSDFQTILDTKPFKETLVWLKDWAAPEMIDGELPNKNTYNDLESRFKEARLKLPEAFEKGKSCGHSLQKWLAQHCSKTNENHDIFDYLTLRRGILDVIQLIENNQKIILQSKFEEILDKTSFLEGLKWQVRDFNLAANPHKSVYFAICDYLSKPFETFNWKNDISNFSVQPEIIPLYLLRNWIAHGLIFGSENTVLNAQITGLAFLWAMKSIFGIEEYGYKEELKRLFSLNTRSFNLLSDYNATLNKDVLEKINTRGMKPTNKRGSFVGNQNWQQENYVSHCYASYLLASQNNSSELKKLTESVYEVL
jgi:hypothetical protein